MNIRERIVKVLSEEPRWLTFDELYNKVRPGCDWTRFAEILEDLVDHGPVQYSLPCGSDTGLYCINRIVKF